MDGEVIVGHLNELYPFRILKDGKREGTNTVYETQLMGNARMGIPAERLLAGERFSVEYAPAEAELSRKMGDVRFTAPISLSNEWSTIRIQHKVAGNKLNKKLAVGVPMVENVAGRQVKGTRNMWMHYVEIEVEREFSGYKSKAALFSRANRNSNGEYLDFGKSGNVINLCHLVA